MGLLLWNSSNNPMSSVRPFNLGLHFLASKVVFSRPSVDIFGKKKLGTYDFRSS